MKKMLSLLLCAVLALAGTFALAEQTGFDFSTLEGIEFDFSSGVGAWYTFITFSKDGSFTGSFYDSDMGTTGEGFPNGTQYGCSFHGKMEDAGAIDEFSRRLKVTELEKDEGQVPEAIEDGVRYVTTEPYGLSAGQEVVLYLPGMPVAKLPEGFVIWSHIHEIDPEAASLPYYGIYNETADSGFVGIPETASTPVGMANPWKDVTAAELKDQYGYSFGIPAGAEDILYRVLVMGDSMAEMQFHLKDQPGMDFVARTVASETFEDISGMYYAWTDTRDIPVDTQARPTWGKALIQTAKDGDNTVSVCLWHEETPGFMWSLSVQAADLQGFDLLSVAEDVYIPMQEKDNGNSVD